MGPEMSRLAFTKGSLSALRTSLLKHARETCAILHGRGFELDGRLARVVVRESSHPEPSDYSIRTATHVQLRPEYVAEAVQRARKNSESVVFVHTHPFALNQFSAVDDAGEAELAAFLKQRVPNQRHVSLLLTPQKSIARELGGKQMLRVVGVGERINWGDVAPPEQALGLYDRQVRVFGAEGQHILRSIRVGIVGLGGTGSVVLQELSHLGVRDFLLIDPDVVEETNLNRLVGARQADVGEPKVTVAERWARELNADSSITAKQESVLKESVARQLADTDFVFCCTDSHGSRAVLNQVAYQYLVPMIDMGVVIGSEKGAVTTIGGRVQMMAPGLACMICGKLLDPDQVRRDMMTEFERRADPYFLGSPQPAPAVISLNATVSSLAVTMFLSAVAGIPSEARLLNYNGISGAVRPAACSQHPSCIVCSTRGALARADEWPLPARQE
jgi:molybdopterin/thiamine biosynthesis adenylyltransferase